MATWCPGSWKPPDVIWLDTLPDIPIGFCRHCGDMRALSYGKVPNHLDCRESARQFTERKTA